MAPEGASVTCGNNEKCLNFKHLVMVPVNCPLPCDDRRDTGGREFCLEIRHLGGLGMATAALNGMLRFGARLRIDSLCTLRYFER
jgi:hypothetical protein